jgi:dynein heavy chain
MEDLKARIIDCEVKLGRAEKLTQGLSDEQQRWAKDIT